jgi:hypothetical protein
LVGLSGIFIGVGEVSGGVAFGLLGSKITTKLGRDPIVILGFIVHVLAFFLIFLNLPNYANFGDTDDIGIFIFIFIFIFLSRLANNEQQLRLMDYSLQHTSILHFHPSLYYVHFYSALVMLVTTLRSIHCSAVCSKNNPQKLSPFSNSHKYVSCLACVT